MKEIKINKKNSLLAKARKFSCEMYEIKMKLEMVVSSENAVIANQENKNQRKITFFRKNENLPAKCTRRSKIKNNRLANQNNSEHF